MKSKKAIKKRFKVTATGKLKKNKSCRRHLMCSKNAKRKRHLRKSELVDEGFARTYRKLLISLKKV